MLERRKRIFLVGCALACGLSSTAWSNPLAVNTGSWALHLPFDLEPFEPLSGKALGMGNAFSAVADDTTAAVFNPAGLTALEKIEVTASLSSSSYDIDYLDSYATLNNIGLGPEMEEISTFSDDNSTLSFLGVTIPIIPKKLVTSLYMRNSDVSATDSQNVGPAAILDPGLNLQQQSISEKNIDEYQRSVYGLAGAFQVNEMFSLGASVNMETLDTDLQERWQVNSLSNNILDSSDEYASRIQGDDTDVTFGIGALIKANEQLSLALSYRQGGSFNIDYTSTETSCSPSDVCNTITEDDQVVFEVPDVWSVGAAWRPTVDWLFSVQTDLVEYSVLTDASTEGITTDEAIDDEFIFRFGAEKSFLVSDSLQYQLRAGFFSDPDHDGFQAIDSARMHYTLGGGITWNNQIKLNLGTSFSEDITNGVLSLSYSL